MGKNCNKKQTHQGRWIHVNRDHDGEDDEVNGHTCKPNWRRRRWPTRPSTHAGEEKMNGSNLTWTTPTTEKMNDATMTTTHRTEKTKDCTTEWSDSKMGKSDVHKWMMDKSDPKVLRIMRSKIYLKMIGCVQESEWSDVFKRMRVMWRVWEAKLTDLKGLNIQRWKKEGKTSNEKGQKSNCNGKKSILFLFC